MRSPRRLIALLCALVLFLPQLVAASPTIYYGSFPNIFNVMDYGAVCDGTTDDTTPIANAAAAASGVGVIGFPVGKTCITNLPVSVTSNTGVMGVGTGGLYATLKAGLSWPTSSPTAHAVLQAGPNGATNYTWSNQGANIWVDRMKIDGTNTMDDEAYRSEGVFLCAVNQAQVTNSYIYNAGEYGIFVGNCAYAGNNYAENISYVTLKNDILDSNGRLGSPGSHADQIGGGYANHELFDGIQCLHSNGTCIDNVFVQDGKWDHITSDMGGTQTGQVWSDVGSSYLDIEHFYLNGGSIHIYGTLGSDMFYPQHITIAHGVILNSNNSILLGGANSIPSSSYLTAWNHIDDVTIMNDQTSCLAGSDFVYSIVHAVHCINWNLSNNGSPAFFLNSEGGVNGSHNNQFFGNVFDAGATPGGSPFFVYDEQTSGYTGANSFYGNTCAQRPGQQCYALYDSSSSPLTTAYGLLNFTGASLYGTLNAAGVSGTAGTFPLVYAGGTQLSTAPHIEAFHALVVPGTSPGPDTLVVTFGKAFTSNPSCSMAWANYQVQYPPNISSYGTTSVTLQNGNAGNMSIDLLCVQQ